MEYIYNILNINEEQRWITLVSNDEFDCEEPDSFFHFLQRIRRGVRGTIKELGEMRYQIPEDNLGLVYQWDEVFCISIIYPQTVSKEIVIDFLEKYFVE